MTDLTENDPEIQIHYDIVKDAPTLTGQNESLVEVFGCLGPEITAF